MKFIDIDNREFNCSNELAFIILKDVIEYDEKIYDEYGKEVDLNYRLLTMCHFIGYLTDEKLLNNALGYLKMFDLFDDIENYKIDLFSYSEIDVIKIKAIYYSLTSIYKLNIKALTFPNSKDLILFKLVLKDRIIEHNFPEVLKSIQKNGVNQFKVNISNMPINYQKNEINKWIRSALDISYNKDTKMFNKDIEHLKEISNHIIELEDEQGEASKEKEFLSNQITHIKKVEIAKFIKDKYSSYKGKDFKILYEALLKLDLFPKKGKRQVFYRCLQNEGYSINNHQLLEDIHFATGTYKKGGNYEESDDEKSRDTIINHLETIINTK